MLKKRTISYMSRGWALLVSLLVAVSTFSGVPAETTAEDFAYTQIARQNYINKKHGLNPVKNEQRIVECILRYGQQYAPTEYISIPDFQRLMVRTARRESHFKNTAYNSRTEARGLFQPIHSEWSYYLHYVDGGKLGKYILNNNITNVSRFYYRIGYNTEIGARALSCFIIHWKGDLRSAVSNYGGWTIKDACPKKAKSYIDYITRIK